MKKIKIAILFIGIILLSVLVVIALDDASIWILNHTTEGQGRILKAEQSYDFINEGYHTNYTVEAKGYVGQRDVFIPLNADEYYSFVNNPDTRYVTVSLYSPGNNVWQLRCHHIQPGEHCDILDYSECPFEPKQDGLYNQHCEDIGSFCEFCYHDNQPTTCSIEADEYYTFECI